ncbi:TrgA family protein [Alphaproteobacteria bacterium GH1-50]|uniref:TrgA family protein n=1 Tax=Kangsaoukella pontilimi TaxID=2691042 RepID=A0A7C9ING5_9RHOB|nr:TrgA family protein [Kangsaoukella pontilimi]MXQ07350.1 TrgA family protein [Kangsaoukella pontilimi]
MPTGGKLVAAIVFGALAYFISDLIKPLLVDTHGTELDWFSRWNGLIGVLMGWQIIGKTAGKSYRTAFGMGLTTLAATVFWCLVLWSAWEMIQKSMRRSYGGAVEAVQDMTQIFVEYAVFAARQEIIIAAVIGALFCAWVTEFFGKRWT